MGSAHTSVWNMEYFVDRVYSPNKRGACVVEVNGEKRTIDYGVSLDPTEHTCSVVVRGYRPKPRGLIRDFLFPRKHESIPDQYRKAIIDEITDSMGMDGINVRTFKFN